MYINSITLYSPKLAEQRRFYGETLGIEIFQSASDFFEIQLQQTKVRFEKTDHAPPYHFAFNIPSNKAAAALNWLKKRTDILPFQGQELIDFSNWNAWAMYFYDADRNIVEFISREKIKEYATEPFSPNQLISISEIGVVVNNIEQTYSWMNKHLNIDVFDGDFDRFCAVGDDHGLFILVDKSKKDWFPNDDPAYEVDFKLEAEVKGQIYQLAFMDGVFVFL